MKDTFMIFFCCCFFSCATSKWKSNYTKRKIDKIQIKYNSTNGFETRIDMRQFVNKPFNKLNRKDVKQNIKVWESIYALRPDSITTDINGKTDSFYTNRNKIAYLTKMKVLSKNIHVPNF